MVDITRFLPIDSKKKVDAVISEFKKHTTKPDTNQKRMFLFWIPNRQIKEYAENTWKINFEYSLKGTTTKPKVAPPTYLPKPTLDDNKSMVEYFAKADNKVRKALKALPAPARDSVFQKRNIRFVSEARQLRQ